MKVHLYTVCWNEADMLAFFFRHYDPWVDRYVIFDDGSDDGSLELMQKHPRVEVRRFQRIEADSFVLSHQRIHNEAWKESRGKADWVLVTAVDEHLELSGGGDQRLYLDECRKAGITLVPAIGYQMISRVLPNPTVRLSNQFTRGMRYEIMNKLSIFDPSRIDTPGYFVGRHRARPQGVVRYPEQDRMLLLHYKYIGFLRTYRRQRALAKRLGSMDLRHRWGHQYLDGPVKHWRAWRRIERKAIELNNA